MSKKSFWDKFAFAYDIAESLNNKSYSSMLDSIVNLIPKNATVLECASGTGTISIAVSKVAEKVICTDLSLPMLDKAKFKANKLNIQNITFKERNLLNLTDKDSSFDVVIAGNVLHLLQNPIEVVKELYRIVKPNGLLILPTFLTVNSNNRFRFLIKLYKLIGFNPVHNYSDVEYKSMLLKCGIGTPDFKVLNGKVPVGFAVFKKF